VIHDRRRPVETGSRWPTDAELGWATTFYDVVTERDLPVTAELSDTEIAFFDSNSKCMARWQYPDIVHAFEPVQRLDYVFNVRANPDALLTVGDADLMRLLLERAPQLGREPQFTNRLFGFVWLIAGIGAIGLFALSLILLVIEKLTGWMPQ